jgi:hypothetical protein
MWLVSPKRRLAYGPIVRVRAETIVWRSANGWKINTAHETIHNGDYSYLPAGPEDGPPEGYTRKETK